jgi:hypothetical protein
VSSALCHVVITRFMLFIIRFVYFYVLLSISVFCVFVLFSVLCLLMYLVVYLFVH